MPIRSDYQPHVDAARKKYGLPPGVIEAVLEQENAGGRDTSTSIGYGKRSQGLGQFQLSTAREYGFKGNAGDLSKPDIGIDLIGKKLREDYARYNDWGKVAANWYGGSGGVKKYGTSEGAKTHIMSKEDGTVSNAPSINDYARSWLNHASRYGLQGAPGPGPLTEVASSPSSQAGLMGMLTGNLIPPEIRALYPGPMPVDDSTNEAQTRIAAEMERLKGDLGTSATRMEELLKSSPQDFAGQANPMANPALSGLGYGFANIASAISGNERYATQEMEAKGAYEQQRQQQMMQARAQTLATQVEKWTHIQNRLEQQGDQYNALLASEKLQKAQAAAHEWDTKMQLYNQAALSSIQETTRNRGEIYKTLLAKGYEVSESEDGGSIKLTPKASGADLQDPKEAEKTFTDLQEIMKDPKFAKGKNAAMNKTAQVRALAAWRKGDVATSAYNRLVANRSAIGELFGLKPEQVDGVIDAYNAEMLREEAYLEMKTGVTRVPGVLELAKKNGLLEGPPPPAAPKVEEPKGETSAQRGARLAEEEINKGRAAKGEKTDKQAFAEAWPPKKPDMSGGPREDYEELIRYYSEIVSGHDSAIKFGLASPEEMTEETARTKLLSYKTQLREFDNKIMQERAKAAQASGKAAPGGARTAE